MSKRVLFLLSFLIFLSVSAQKEHISSYNVITIDYKINDKWYSYVEGQLRGIEDFSYPDYYELKGGVGYKITPNNKFLVGIGRYGNYTNRSFVKEEFRIWLQDIQDLHLGRFKFENRVRAEKRWFYEPKKDATSDRIRLRYRLNISAPLNSKTVEPGTISANVYDEVFFIPADEVWFARNRVFSGLSYQIDHVFALSGGYLWQREFSSKGYRNLDFLYVALSVDIDPSTWKKNDLQTAD